MIELQDLRFFLAVAREQHLGRAARRLNMAQAPLTRQLRDLERSLGITLFERSNRRVALTAAGAALADGARRTLSELERALDTAQRTAGDCEMMLRVHSSAGATELGTTALLQGFRNRHPDVRVDLVDAVGDGAGDEAEFALRALQRGALHVALVLGPVDGAITEESGLRALLVQRERFVVALPAHHVQASRRLVPLRSLAGEPLVTLAADSAPRLHEVIGAACQGAGFSPTIASEASTYAAVLDAVTAGAGIGLVPASCAERHARGLEVRAITGMTATADVAMVYRRDEQSVAVHRLVSAARQLAR